MTVAGTLPERPRAAIVVTDLVASTRLTQSLGTVDYQRDQEAFEGRMRDLCRSRGGAIPDHINSGDGLTAAFVAGVDALWCAQQSILEAESIGLQLRSAVHVCDGDPDRGDLADVDRICGRAGPGEIGVTAPGLDEIPALADLGSPAGTVELSTGPVKLHRLRGLIPPELLG